MNRSNVERRGLAVLAAIIVLLASSPATAAATLISQTGKHGAYQLIDTRALPGVACHYEDGAGSGELVLFELALAPPDVYARDRTVNRDGQYVGWRAIVQRRDAGQSRWAVAKRSAISKAWAWDDSAAQFSNTLVIFNINSRYGSDVRVRFKMYWYSATGALAGRVTLQADWYATYRFSSEGYEYRGPLDRNCPDYVTGQY